MKKKGLLTLLGSICLILVLAALPFMAACAQPAPAPAPAPTPAPAPAPVPTPKPEPIVLKAVSFLPGRAGAIQIFQTYIKAVNERAKGELILNYLGGPEVIPGGDQPMAAKKGVIDIAYTITPKYEGLVPIGDTVTLTEIFSADEERERGVWDYLRELHEEAGLFFLARGNLQLTPMFFMFGNKNISSLEDFRGLRGGTGSMLPKPLMEELGMGFTVIAMPEIYTSLERGLVDYYFTTPSTLFAIGAYKVTKYAIDHPLYSNNSTIILGLDRWNQLPKHLQDLLIEVEIETEAERLALTVADDTKKRQMVIDGGVDFMKLPPGEAERFVEMAYQLVRDEMIRKFPETAPKLIELMSK